MTSDSAPAPPGPLPRLAPETLARVRDGVTLPAYDRVRLQPRIVHLGLGAFFRAHGAEYTDDVLANGHADWGIVGVSLQRPDQRDRLGPQSGLYTLIRRDGEGERARIVGSVLDVLVAPEGPEAVLTRLADSATAIVSLTITEKGYGHDPATGRLDLERPEIAHDLEHPRTPRTAVGFMVEALRRRREQGLAPFTVLCCDNLPSNGRLVAGLVTAFAAARDDALAAWIERNATFPATMVDRIVPATTPEDLEAAARLTGLDDRAAVAHEPFRQWVIEDRFVDGRRPDWGRAGAELVADVAPYEHMKLRLLNGAHSALAYLGYLAGHSTISDVVADPALKGFVERLWQDEMIPVLAPPPATDLAGYVRQLMARFQNPTIRHRTWQIAMDGSQKLPQRLLGTVRERLKEGWPIERLALAIAAWAVYVGGRDERGRPIDVRDPLAADLRRRLEAAGPEPSARVDALLGVDAVFGSDLPHDQAFRSALTGAYHDLVRLKARSAAARLGESL